MLCAVSTPRLGSLRPVIYFWVLLQHLKTSADWILTSFLLWLIIQSCSVFFFHVEQWQNNHLTRQPVILVDCLDWHMVYTREHSVDCISTTKVNKLLRECFARDDDCSSSIFDENQSKELELWWKPINWYSRKQNKIPCAFMGSAIRTLRSAT